MKVNLTDNDFMFLTAALSGVAATTKCKETQKDLNRVLQKLFKAWREAK